MRQLIGILLISLLVAACGVKGDLYIPQEHNGSGLDD